MGYADVRVPHAGPHPDMPLLHATAHPYPDVHLHAAASAGLGLTAYRRWRKTTA